MRVEVKPKAKLQKAEGGGGEKSPVRARAQQPSLAKHTRRGVVTPGRPEEGAGPGRAFPAFPAPPAPPAPSRPRLALPLPTLHWAPSAPGCLSRLASRRPGPARPTGKCPELPPPPPPTRPVAVWETGVRPRAAECDGRGRGPPGAAASAAPRGPCIS